MLANSSPSDRIKEVAAGGNLELLLPLMPAAYRLASSFLGRSGPAAERLSALNRNRDAPVRFHSGAILRPWSIELFLPTSQAIFSVGNSCPFCV
jgi:hypothetical protein